MDENEIIEEIKDFFHMDEGYTGLIVGIIAYTIGMIIGTLIFKLLLMIF